MKIPFCNYNKIIIIKTSLHELCSYVKIFSVLTTRLLDRKGLVNIRETLVLGTKMKKI